MASLFQEDTFQERAPDLPELCTTTNPMKGVKGLRGEVVRAGGGKKGVTTGMRELSTMGWYRLAMFAVVRTKCCESPPPLATPTSLPCNLDNRLERFARDVKARDELAAAAALEQVTKSFQCLGRGGGADFFGQQGLPSGGEQTTFEAVLSRLLKK